MSSQINPYNIDSAYPVAGVNQSTQGFRSNFLGIQNNFIETENEINDLLNKVIVSAPLTYGSNSNINNFAGSPINNVGITDFGYGVLNHGTISTSGTIAFDFTQGYYHNVDIEGSGTTIVVNPVNFPNLGYSEIVIGASTTSAPQFISLNNLSVSGNIFANNVAGYNSVTNIFTLSSVNIPYELTLGSIDGINWLLSVKDNSAVAKAYTPVSSLGAVGDTAGMIAYDATYIYICIANYNGATEIWKRLAASTF